MADLLSVLSCAHDLALGHDAGADLAACLAASDLLPALAAFLRNDSLDDIRKRDRVYTAVLETVTWMARSTDPAVSGLIGATPDGQAIADCLDRLERVTDTYRLVMATDRESGQAARDDLVAGVGLAHAAVQAAINQQRDRDGDGGDGDGDTGLGDDGSSVEAAYVGAMRPHQFATFRLADLPGGPASFHWAEQLAETPAPSGARLTRIASEASTLATSLPLSAASACFIRMDEDRIDVRRLALNFFFVFFFFFVAAATLCVVVLSTSHSRVLLILICCLGLHNAHLHARRR